MSRRGWEIKQGGRTLGELLEGPGPFISTSHFAGPHPRLTACAYVSCDEASEASIGRSVLALTIDAVLAALAEAGFELSPIEAPVGALPMDSPRSPSGDSRG